MALHNGTKSLQSESEWVTLPWVLVEDGMRHRPQSVTGILNFQMLKIGDQQGSIGKEMGLAASSRCEQCIAERHMAVARRLHRDVARPAHPDSRLTLQVRTFTERHQGGKHGRD